MDEKAWADFQRKKTALEHSRELQQLGSTSPTLPPQPSPYHTPPVPIPVPALNNTPELFGSTVDLVGSKSFPYGDEIRDQGVEVTAELSGQIRPRPFIPMSDFQTEEKKDDSFVSSREPEASKSGLHLQQKKTTVPSTMQSIEQVLAEYNNDPTDDRVANSSSIDVVDEVAKLSRFVQRFQKRKERRVQFEAERMSQVGTLSADGNVSRHISLDGSISSKDDSFQQSRPRRHNENLAHVNNMRPGAMPPSQPRPSIKNAHNKPLPSTSTAYRGITMAGEMYTADDPYMDTIAYPSMSMSGSSDADSFDAAFREEEARSRSGRRLGITPFSIPHDASPLGYGAGPLSPITGGIVLSTPPKDDDGPHYYNRRNATATTTTSDRARLSALRSNEAIIDSSQSDVNFGGNQSDPTEGTTSSRVPFQSKAPTRPTSLPKTNSNVNPNFNKLRNLFEDKEQKAIFPPDEYWQSGKLS